MGVSALARELIESAALQGRDALQEHEAYALLAEAGLAVPQSVFIPAGTRPCPDSIEAIPGDRVVIKVGAPFLRRRRVEPALLQSGGELADALLDGVDEVVLSGLLFDQLDQGAADDDAVGDAGYRRDLLRRLRRKGAPILWFIGRHALDVGQ